MTTYHDQIENWADRAVQELQDLIDEAEEAGCQNPYPGTAALIDEYNQIKQLPQQPEAQ
jgi:ArsR family metal-binding transcriptional regulator